MLPRGVAPSLSDVPQGAYPPLTYHGGNVQTAPSIYVVYWGFTSDPAGEAPRLTAFLRAVGSSSWLSTVTQYYGYGRIHVANPSNQLKGVWNDTVHPVPAHPTDRQIAAEAVLLAEKFAVNPNAAYIVATPHLHSTSGFPHGWCAYHGTATVRGKYIAYTNLPYMSDAGYSCGANSVNRGALGKLDGVSIIAGHELSETQTDPGTSAYGGGWWDSGGNEIADKCVWYNLKNSAFPNGTTFPTQPLWSNAAHNCVQ